jgi:hypothetical protein
LVLAISPVIIHTLLKELDTWILGTNTKLINELLKHLEAFTDTLFLRLENKLAGHPSYLEPSLLFK